MLYRDYLSDVWAGYTNNTATNVLVPIAWQK
jgi:hypothetical protein